MKVIFAANEKSWRVGKSAVFGVRVQFFNEFISERNFDRLIICKVSRVDTMSSLQAVQNRICEVGDSLADHA
eukprot:scaffold22531_cov98-Cylindrotheca_fusiformis.AAC.2